MGEFRKRPQRRRLRDAGSRCGERFTVRRNTPKRGNRACRRRRAASREPGRNPRRLGFALEVPWVVRAGEYSSPRRDLNELATLGRRRTSRFGAGLVESLPADGVGGREFRFAVRAQLGAPPEPNPRRRAGIASHNADEQQQVSGLRAARSFARRK